MCHIKSSFSNLSPRGYYLKCVQILLNALAYKVKPLRRLALYVRSIRAKAHSSPRALGVADKAKCAISLSLKLLVVAEMSEKGKQNYIYSKTYLRSAIY